MSDGWERADRVSDEIVDLLNRERRKPDFSPLQMLAGQLLALCATASTMPRSMAPQPFIEVMDAVQRCLVSMMQEEMDDGQGH